VTALLISTKYEEIYPPELKDLLSVSENKFTKTEVLKMESKILSTLEFNFMYPSSLRFLERYRKLSNTASDD
jgi:G2/mitotic-specific cyclin-B, other